MLYIFSRSDQWSISAASIYTLLSIYSIIISHVILLNDMCSYLVPDTYTHHNLCCNMLRHPSHACTTDPSPVQVTG